MRTLINGRKQHGDDPMELVLNDIAAIRRDVTTLVGGGIGAIGGRARETLNWAGENAKTLAADTRKRAVRAHAILGKTTGARPLTTIATAAVAGAVGFKLLTWALRR